MKTQIKWRASQAAEFLQSKFPFFVKPPSTLAPHAIPPIGIVLGTGFGDKLKLERLEAILFEEVPGFTGLQKIEGHPRKFMYGSINKKEIIALSGRIHLNEDPGNPDIFKMVRLQVETLIHLGVKKLILTCAAGALPNTKLQVGNLVVIDGFVTLFAPQMPLWAGEFISPENTLSERLRKVALEAGEKYKGRIRTGGYAMVLGPHFEGRKYDKLVLRNTGASIVGMSILPETCIAALYPGVEVLAIAFVTNDSLEVHSHEENVKRAKQFAQPLSGFLRELILNC